MQAASRPIDGKEIGHSVASFLPRYFKGHPVIGLDGQAETDPADAGDRHVPPLPLLRGDDRLFHQGEDRDTRKDRIAREMAGIPGRIAGNARPRPSSAPPCPRVVKAPAGMTSPSSPPHTSRAPVDNQPRFRTGRFLSAPVRPFPSPADSSAHEAVRRNRRMPFFSSVTRRGCQEESRIGGTGSPSITGLPISPDNDTMS